MIDQGDVCKVLDGFVASSRVAYICTSFSKCSRDFKIDSTSASYDRLLFFTLSMNGTHCTSHNCDFAREIGCFHNVLVWGLCEYHLITLVGRRLHSRQKYEIDQSSNEEK
jgi:hypothetical protein